MKEKKKEQQFPRVVERRCSRWAKRRKKLDSMDELATLHSVCRETTLVEIVSPPLAEGERFHGYETTVTTTPLKGDPGPQKEDSGKTPIPLMIISEPSSDGSGVEFAGLGIACPNCTTKLMLPDEHICNYEYFLQACPHCSVTFNYTPEFDERVLDRLSYYRQAYRFDKEKYLKERQGYVDQVLAECENREREEKEKKGET